MVVLLAAASGDAHGLCVATVGRMKQWVCVFDIVVRPRVRYCSDTVVDSGPRLQTGSPWIIGVSRFREFWEHLPWTANELVSDI